MPLELQELLLFILTYYKSYFETFYLNQRKN